MALGPADTGRRDDQPYQVMVVDDSAVIRGLLTRVLEADPAINIAASAANGEVALKMLDRQDIDVIVLDIEMPVMDGLTAVPKLLAAKPGVRVIMASTLTRKNAEISLKALSLGASDYLTKPSTGGELTSAEDFKRDLTEKVKALAQSGRGGRAYVASAPKKPTARRPEARAERPQSAARPAKQAPAAIALRRDQMFPPDLIAIASSTGGPQALFEVLGHLKPAPRVPLLVTQHMPATFTSLLAQHINRQTGIPCKEGEDGEAIMAGCIYVAPGGFHMLAERRGGGLVIRLSDGPPENFCRPSADPMLRALAPIFQKRLMLVVLTGMGTDGLKGAQCVIDNGGSVVAQDEASSVVWGMPGAVANAGLCSAVLPLKEIGPYVGKFVMMSAA